MDLVDLRFSELSLTKLAVIEDNNSMLHAIANAYCYTYITEKLNNVSINRVQFIKKLREQLAPLAISEKMKMYLQSDNPMSIDFIPLIAKEIGYNIFVINVKTQLLLNDYVYTSYLNTVYGSNEKKSSIILLYNPQTNHYDTGALVDLQSRHWSVFPPTHELIVSIMDEIALQIKM